MQVTFVSVFLIVIELVFGLLFFIVGIMALIRFLNVMSGKIERDELIQKEDQISMISTLYYGVLTLMCFTQVCFLEYFGVRAIQDISILQNTSTEKSVNESLQDGIITMFNNSEYVPDAMFFVLYTLMFCQYVFYNMYGHLGEGNILTRDSKTFQMAKTFQVPSNVKILTGLYILIQIGIIIAYNSGIIGDTAKMGSVVINSVDILVNGTIPTLFICYQVYKWKRYSGSPYRSQKCEKNITKMEMIMIYFAVGRYIECLYNIFMIFDPEIAYRALSDQQGTPGMYANLGLLTIEILVCQLAPFLLTLQSSYVQIMSKSFTEEKLLQLDSEARQPQNEITEISEYTRDSNEEESYKKKLSITDHQDRTIIQIDIDEVTFTGQFKDQSLSTVQLGSLSKGIVKSGKYQDKEFIVRKIYVKRLSQYLIEEMNKNAQEYRNLSCKYIQPIKAISFDNENVYFFTPYFKNGTLGTMLNSGDNINDSMKKNIILQVCTGMCYFYKQNPTIPHGHLIPNNIMITKANDIKVENSVYYIIPIKLIDFGLAAMKKYIALTTGYSTKCQYSAPEQLKERSLTPTFSQAADVYAFGVLTWELYHQMQAFKGVSVQELVKIVGEEKKRPKIEDETDGIIAQVIRACWQDEADKRPTFQALLQLIQGQEGINPILEV